MKMKVKVCIADPAGNITVFVLSPLKREQYAEAAKRLLAVEEFHAEQVGFVEKSGDGSLHMQMMGGEFCGNAARSFGYLKSLWDEVHPVCVEVDVSGSPNLLTVEVDREAGTSRTIMPLPGGLEDVKVGEYGKFPLVAFDGISHMIVKGPARGDKFVKEALEAARSRGKCSACGIMFLEPGGDGREKSYRLTPAVWVADTDSLVWEGSCGSGSMACAVWLSDGKEDGTYVYVLKQPGGVIEATVVRGGGRVVQCKMGGPVTISRETEIEIEL